MERLIAILQRLRPDVDFSRANNILGDGLLDSMDIVALITDINLELGVSIPIEKISEENFSSVERIWKLVHSCSEDKT